MCCNYAPFVAPGADLYAGACECHLCWKPQGCFFFSGLVGVSSQGWWGNEAHLKPYPGQLYGIPHHHHHLPFSDPHAAKVSGLTRMREREQYSPNINPTSQRKDTEYTPSTQIELRVGARVDWICGINFTAAMSSGRSCNLITCV